MRSVGGTPANLVELYARFLGSPNFRAWFSLARAPLMHLVKMPGLDLAAAAAPVPGGAQVRSACHGLRAEHVGMWSACAVVPNC